jgi:hypothetical protein
VISLDAKSHFKTRLHSDVISFKLAKCIITPHSITTMPMTIIAVHKIISEILNVKKNNASLLVRDDNTIILTDCMYIHEKAFVIITEQIPQLEISMHASEHSSSGYIVLFTYEPLSSVLVSAHGFQITAFLCIFFVLINLPTFSCWRILFQ